MVDTHQHNKLVPKLYASFAINVNNKTKNARALDSLATRFFCLVQL